MGSTGQTHTKALTEIAEAIIGVMDEVEITEHDILDSAAEGGHLSVLQWATENGCPWWGSDLDDSYTVYNAARICGNPDVLKYAIHHAGLYRPGNSQLMYFLLHGSWGLSTPVDP